MGEEENGWRKVREERVDEGSVARLDDGNGVGGRKKIGERREQAALGLRLGCAAAGIERVEEVLNDC